MNVLTIIVLSIFLLFTFIGYKRGLIKSVFKLILSVVAIVLAYLLTPLVSGFLYEKTSIDDAIGKKVYSIIEEIAENQVKEELEETFQEVDPELVEELTDLALSVEPSRSTQIDIIRKMKLPKFMTDAIISNNNDEMREELGAEDFYKYLAYYISYMVTNAIAFVVTFVIMLVIANLIYFAAGIVSKLPIVGGIDKLGGIIFGLAEALLITWVIFVVATIFVNTSFGANIHEQIDESAFLSFLDKKNILNSVVIKLVK